ncbi:hypothetical protein IPF89_00870 [Candidatus Saccharibacteria bacterium]|nr:MAG: hypothetical protein IPF89_00870 [Candidatus Saccharibacteria bacterium]
MAEQMEISMRSWRGASKPASMNVVESPLTTGSAGTTPTNYGREYYYDYPSSKSIARFIAVSADIDTYVNYG